MKKILRPWMLGAAALCLIGCTPEPQPPVADVPDISVDTSDSTSGCGAGPACGEGLVCDTASGQCVGCLNDSDCTKGVCHPVQRGCVACIEDVDCTSGRCHPLAAICVQCLEDDDCIEGVCDGESLMCIGCMTDADCESGVCNQDTRSCVGCASDATCDDSDPCTNESCVQGECSYEVLADGSICDDGDPCTVKETCTAGLCSAYLTAPECCEEIQCDGNHTPTDTDGDGCDDACAQNECTDDSACAEAGFCFSPQGECGAVLGLCVKVPESCKEQQAPVCGCDGETYESACAASIAKVNVAEEGPCPLECEELICAPDAKASDLTGDGCPDTCVCPDGTFTVGMKACEEEDGVKCTTSKDCAALEFCAKPSGMCDVTGTCTVKPLECEEDGNVVCGCNGKLFESECMASQFGVSVGPKALCDTGG